MTRFHVRHALFFVVPFWALIVACSGKESLPATTQSADACESYCDDVMETCVGDQAAFADRLSCLVWCRRAGWPEGTAGDTTENTIGCRVHFLHDEASPATERCAAASSMGGEICGTLCENFCDAALAQCGDLYANADDCVATCEGWPAQSPDSSDADAGASPDVETELDELPAYYLPTPRADDTLACRQWYLQSVLASDGARAMYCDELGPTGGDFCAHAPDRVAGNCETYCATLEEACTGDDRQYETLAACESFCSETAQWTDGPPEDSVGNSLNCRVYYASLAQASGDGDYCAAAGTTGANTCGSWCENYCFYIQSACPDQEPDCRARCDAWSTSGAINDVAGNTVQCRLTYVLQAATDSKNAQEHCSNAREDSPLCL